jgi:dolichol-phosphate mannosyltransferase
MKRLVVTPTYNEKENLALFVEKVWQNVPDAHILVVDDNSPDGTGKIADDISARSDGRLHVMHREKKAGLGRAYVAGFRWAIENSYDRVVQMDTDLSHDPAFLPTMFSEIEGVDLVIGSRYIQGICVVNWDFKRLLLSKGASKYVQFVTGMPYTDPTGGFKCWKRETLEKINLDGLFSNGYIFQVETTFEAHRRGMRIKEVPIIFYERNLGRSKMDVGIMFEAATGVLRIRMRGIRG